MSTEKETTKVLATDTEGQPPMKKASVEKGCTNSENAEIRLSKLEHLGYKFNNEGQLRKIETDEPFEFNVYEEHSKNQKRYEALGEAITEHVYELLETDGHLIREYIPVDAKKDEDKTFVFISKDAYTNENKLMLLIHGSGVVRAGQWARRLIINDNLDSGTQLPYIKRAHEQGYGVIVLNTNDGQKREIRGSASPEEHTNYVWEKCVQRAKAKHIAIVAHSYGGVCTLNLVKRKFSEMKDRVFAIAFTDSVHSLRLQKMSPTETTWLFGVARNWVNSAQPLDTPETTFRANDVPCVSAETTSHEMTSWKSFKSIFTYLEEKYEKYGDPKKQSKKKKGHSAAFKSDL